MIILESFWMGRDKKYASSLTLDIVRNARETVRRSNMLIQMYEADTGEVVDRVSSGWRPPAINDVTSNAALHSNHLDALAVDLEDLQRKFAAWCVLHPEKLAECGLWMEDPRWTPTWVHLQTIPPKSGKRIYIPNMKRPMAAALPGQKPIPTTIR